jgi:hypothetical protein
MKQIQPIPILAICALLAISAMTCLAQGVEELRTNLKARAGFTEDELSTLDGGGVLVKLLPVSDKREIAVYGVMRLRGVPDVIVKAFQDSMVQQNSTSILARGKFSDPPTQADVETLSLEERDIEDLRHCVVGNCELKISAAMIVRFQREVNWAASDYGRQANNLFREILLDYMRDYRTRGDAALIEYHDQRRAVSLREEQQSLLDRMIYLNVFAPEFTTYIRNFPDTQLSDVESHINWTKLKFGLKPVTIITHVATFKRSNDSARKIFSISKQIYANHYLDSSLAATTVIGIATPNGVPESYLLYTNYSRADSLAGSFSRVKRGLVESESIENLNALLLQTRANAAVVSANQSGSNQAVHENRVIEWLFRRTRLYALFLALLVLGVLIVLSRRNANRTQVRASSLNANSTKGT